jgi:hypothetical protein
MDGTAAAALSTSTTYYAKRVSDKIFTLHTAKPATSVNLINFASGNHLSAGVKLTATADNALCKCTSKPLGAMLTCTQVIVPRIEDPRWTITGTCAYKNDIIFPEVTATFEMTLLPCGSPASAGVKVTIASEAASTSTINLTCKADMYLVNSCVPTFGSCAWTKEADWIEAKSTTFEATFEAGTTETSTPIPGLAYGIPVLGSVGLFLKVKLEPFSAGKLPVSIAVDACLKAGTKLCGEQMSESFKLGDYKPLDGIFPVPIPGLNPATINFGICAPTPAPTPAPKVTYSTSVTGYTVTTFTTAHQAAYRGAVAAKASVAVSKVALKNIVAARRRLAAWPWARQLAATSIKFDVEIETTTSTQATVQASITAWTAAEIKTGFVAQLGSASLSAPAGLAVSGATNMAAPAPAPAAGGGGGGGGGAAGGAVAAVLVVGVLCAFVFRKRKFEKAASANPNSKKKTYTANDFAQESMDAVCGFLQKKKNEEATPAADVGDVVVGTELAVTAQAAPQATA